MRPLTEKVGPKQNCEKKKTESEVAWRAEAASLRGNLWPLKSA